MELALYIYRVLTAQPTITFSWGFHRPCVIENGMAFRVDGFLHTGRVEVIYNEGQDLFSVRLVNLDGSEKSLTEQVYLDQLVDVIDGQVERCKNYKERIKKGK